MLSHLGRYLKGEKTQEPNYNDDNTEHNNDYYTYNTNTNNNNNNNCADEEALKRARQEGKEEALQAITKFFRDIIFREEQQDSMKMVQHCESAVLSNNSNSNNDNNHNNNVSDNKEQQREIRLGSSKQRRKKCLGIWRTTDEFPQLNEELSKLLNEEVVDVTYNNNDNNHNNNNNVSDVAMVLVTAYGSGPRLSAPRKVAAVIEDVRKKYDNVGLLVLRYGDKKDMMAGESPEDKIVHPTTSVLGKPFSMMLQFFEAADSEEENLFEILDIPQNTTYVAALSKKLKAAK